MKLGPEELRRLARLAALDVPSGRASLISDDEARALAEDVSAILEHVRAISALDLSAVPPTSHGMPLPTALREDTPAAPLARARALEGAPEPRADGFAVPKVVE